METLLLYHREYTSRPGLCSSFGSSSNFLENFRCRRADQQLIEGADGDLVPPLACRFNKDKPNVVAVADEDGAVLILDTQASGLNALKQEWRAHKNAVFDIDWAVDGNHLLTASGDQTAQLWDVESETSVSTFKGHSSSIKTISCSGDKHMFATGARDGHVMIWDTRVRAKTGYIPPINTIQNAHTILVPEVGSASKKKRTTKIQQQANSQQTVTAVLFQDDMTLATAGSVDGSVKLWDLRKNYTMLKSEAVALHTFPYAGNSARSHGFSSLVFDLSRTRLFANCMDNTVYLYDCAGLNTKPVASYRGHVNSSFYVKLALSPDDVFLMSGSTDKHAYIWRVNEPHRSPLTLKGHNDEVSAVAWSPVEYTTAVTLSDDCTVCTWKVVPKDLPPPSDPGPGDHVMGTAEWIRRDVGVGATSCTASHLSSAILTPSRRLPTNCLASPLVSPATTPNKIPRPRVTGITPTLPQHSPTVTGMSRRHHTTPQSPMPVKSPAATANRQSGNNTPVKDCSDLLKSPLKSPRQIHIMLSPRKTPIPGCFDALSPRKTPGRSPSRKQQSPYGARSVKRKLCPENESEPSPRKRIRSDVGMNGIAPLGTPNRPLGSSVNITPAKSAIDAAQQRLNFDRPNSRILQSPTMNLPNYVLNPEPRTPQPVKREDSTKENSQRNWLTEMKQRREVDGGGDIAVTPSPRRAIRSQGSTSKLATASVSTPRSSSRKAQNKDTSKSNTDTSKTKTPSSRRSILSYFSPKDQTKKK